MGEDRGEITVGEAACIGGGAQCLIDLAAAVEFGEVDGLGELAPDACCAGCRGGDQPCLGARTDRQERFLIAGAGSWLALDRAGRPGRVVALVDARPARRGQRVTGDLAWPIAAVGVNDDELGAVGSRPDALVDERARDGVERAANADRRLPGHLPGLAEADGVRHLGQPMQPLAFLGEHHRRRATGDPMLTRVDALTELHARPLERNEVLIAVAEVVVGRDQIGLRDPDRRLAAALALRVGRHARRNGQAVVAADRHDRRVADRDPADVIDRDGLLVVRQRIGRRPTEHPQRPVQRHHHRRRRLVPQRQHHPEPAPRQPGAEQHRRPARDDRPVTVVPLHPQARLDDPRPCAATVLGTPAALRVGDRAARRALRTEIAHRDQPLMRDIGADLAARAINPLLDLLREPIDTRPRPHRNRQSAAGLITSTHPVRDRLVITTRQLRRPAQRAGQVKRLQDLHHFLRTLQAGPPHASTTRRAGHYRPIRTRSWGEPMATSREIRRPPVGSFDGRLRGDSHGRRHPLAGWMIATANAGA